MIDRYLRTLWPLAQTPNLGNFLTFRKEIELLSVMLEKQKGVVYFQGISPEAIRKIGYLEDTLLCSLLPIDLEFEAPQGKVIDWPPNHPDIARWCYGSFKRVALLSEKVKSFPSLIWPSEVLDQAKGYYSQLSQNGTTRVVAIHLKRQAGGPEESNATLEHWFRLFEKNRKIIFLLLGQDAIPPIFFSLPNLFHADPLGIPLSVQLALCSISDAFMGMASGICNGACLSKVPYTIFKHPEHHVKEMELELGNSDQLPFALENQKLWRRIDSFENLTLGLAQCLPM